MRSHLRCGDTNLQTIDFRIHCNLQPIAATRGRNENGEGVPARSAECVATMRASGLGKLDSDVQLQVTDFGHCAFSAVFCCLAAVYIFLAAWGIPIPG